MWPLGHAAVGYLLYTLATRARFDRPPTALALCALLVGTQFPDLVDKPLAWYVGVLPTGRTLAHSLLVLIPVSLVVLALARRYDRTELGFAFVLGALSHAVVDVIPALWGAATPTCCSGRLCPLRPTRAAHRPSWGCSSRRCPIRTSSSSSSSPRSRSWRGDAMGTPASSSFARRLGGCFRVGRTPETNRERHAVLTQISYGALYVVS